MKEKKKVQFKTKDNRVVKFFASLGKKKPKE